MPLTINTNSATAPPTITYHATSPPCSLTRLSSGSRIVQPVDDAGGLAVSMKLESSIVRLGGRRVQTPLLFSRSRMEFWLRQAKSSPDDRTQGIEPGRDEERLRLGELQP